MEGSRVVVNSHDRRIVRGGSRTMPTGLWTNPPVIGPTHKT